MGLRIMTQLKAEQGPDPLGQPYPDSPEPQTACC